MANFDRLMPSDSLPSSALLPPDSAVHTSSDPPLSSFLRKRKRLAKACDTCHKAKRRCDGTVPCSNCYYASKACTYTDSMGRPIPAPRSSRREWEQQPNQLQPASSTSDYRSSYAHQPPYPPNNSHYAQHHRAYPLSSASVSALPEENLEDIMYHGLPPVNGGGANAAGGGQGKDVFNQALEDVDIQQLMVPVDLTLAEPTTFQDSSMETMQILEPSNDLFNILDDIAMSEVPEPWTTGNEGPRDTFHATMPDLSREEPKRRGAIQERGQDDGREKQKREARRQEEHKVQGSGGSGRGGDENGEAGGGGNNREAGGLSVLSLINERMPEDGTKPFESFDAARGTVWQLLSAILSKKAAYKALLESTGQKAQVTLDILHKSLDSEDVPEKLRLSALSAMIRLCGASGVYPQCLELRGVRYDREPIASGSFGDIWKGHLGTRIVCLKVARVYAGSEVEDVIKSHSGEAILWSQLNHPNVLPFYGIYRLDKRLGRVGLVSPWMRNGNATEYLKANPEVPRMSLIHDILAGLGYLHEQSVVHGDLKGANILISPDGSACLADFGLSSVVNPEGLRWTSLKTMTKAGGTARWEAPELMDGPEGGASPRPTFLSDVYSVASVMYEVLTGQVPYYELPRDATVISRVMRGIKPTRPSPGPALELSDEIWKVMEGCWSQSPGERPTVNQVVEQLHKIPQSELTARRMAGYRMQERGESDTETEVLPPRSFRDAIRGYYSAFSKTEIDLLREYQN